MRAHCAGPTRRMPTFQLACGKGQQIRAHPFFHRKRRYHNSSTINLNWQMGGPPERRRRKAGGARARRSQEWLRHEGTQAEAHSLRSVQACATGRKQRGQQKRLWGVATLHPPSAGSLRRKPQGKQGKGGCLPHSFRRVQVMGQDPAQGAISGRDRWIGRAIGNSHRNHTTRAGSIATEAAIPSDGVGTREERSLPFTGDDKQRR